MTFLNPVSGPWNVLLHGYPTAPTSTGSIRATWGQGFAVRLDGISGYGSAPGVGGAVGNSTWEAWVRLPAYPTGNTGFRHIVFRWGMYSYGAPIVNASTGAVGAGGTSCPSGAETTASLVTPGVWHHVAAHYAAQPGPIVVYVDGVEVARNNAGLTCIPHQGWTTLLGATGNTSISSFLRADVDEARSSNVMCDPGSFVPQRRFTTDGNTLSV